MRPIPGTDEIRIGISACLLGERVRWNGDHKRDSYLVDTVGRFVRYVPVCPEMEMGLGTPREPVRLVRGSGKSGATRLVEVKGGRDHTAAMDAWAAGRLKEIARLDLCGFILKSDSPSCGLERVRVYDRHDVPSKSGRGRFAAALLRALPDLPVEEEGRLHDPRRRESFFERVFAWRRLGDLFGGRWTLRGLAAFHAREELLLMAHHVAIGRALGRLVAHGQGMPRRDLAAAYRAKFMAALRHVRRRDPAGRSRRRLWNGRPAVA